MNPLPLRLLRRSRLRLHPLRFGSADTKPVGALFASIRQA